MEQIKTNPDPYAPIFLSQGFRVGDLCHISGQAGYDDDGVIVKGGLDAQCDQAMRNLKRALEAGGSSMKNVVKVTIYLRGTEFAELRALRRKWFSDPPPAVTIVQIQALYTPEALVEIDAVGVVAA